MLQVAEEFNFPLLVDSLVLQRTFCLGALPTYNLALNTRGWILEVKYSRSTNPGLSVSRHSVLHNVGNISGGKHLACTVSGKEHGKGAKQYSDI